MTRTVDINADLGESYGRFVVGNDGDLIPLLTSANVACGFHGGDPRVMEATVRACKAAGVAVGAHPSFPDLVGFGRRAMALTAAEAEADVIYQVAALDGFCRRHGVTMQHVKPHGALYTEANRNRELAKGVVAGIVACGPRLMLVCQAGTGLARAGEQAGLRIAYEAFADRSYEADGSLTPRSVAGSVIHDPERACEQALRMVTEGTVVARDGAVVDIQVDTICAHGDNPRTVELIQSLRARLAAVGVELRALA